MEDLKRGRTVTDPETKEVRFVPGREDSLERLIENGEQFAQPGRSMEEQTVTTLLLERALAVLTPLEREMVEELYFLEKTEREVGKDLHLADATVHRRKVKVLEKLWGLLESHPEDF